MIRPLKECPVLELYKQVFPIDKGTIIAYDHVIYHDGDIPDHLIVHEEHHFVQQDKIGLDKWIERYLRDPKFRFEQEAEAYKMQCRSVKDRNKRNFIRLRSAEALASPLYGSITNIRDALHAIT